MNSFIRRIKIVFGGRGVGIFTLFYAGLLFGFALFRYKTLLIASIREMEYATAFKVLVAVSMNLLPEEHLVIWLALFGSVSLNLLLLSVYVRKVGAVIPLSSVGFGVGGISVFLFGMGCLSCGAVIGAFVASLLGVGTIHAAMQLGESTFVWIGIGVVTILAGYLFKKVTDPFVC